MAREEKRKDRKQEKKPPREQQEGREPIKDRRPAIDPYTGEPIPEEEIPAYPVSESSFADETENAPMPEDEAVDFLMVEHGVNDEGVMDQIDDYTADEDVLEDFAERQDLGSGGSKELYESLIAHTGRTPDLSGDDIDADWEMVDVTGEEGVGGSTPTPDQDIVEELGEALGIEYDDTEELNTRGKFERRDLDRYELDPESADDQDVTADDQPMEEDRER